MTGRRLGFVLLLAATLGAASAAAQVSVTMAVTPARAVVGDTVNLTVSVSGKLSEVTHPHFELPEGLRLLRREPQVSQRLEIVNGQYSRAVDFTYLVSCAQKGAFTVPAPSVQADGTMYKGNDATLTVLDGDAAAAQGGGDSATVRLDATVVPQDACVGQAVAVVVRLYVPRSVIGNGRWGWVEKPSGEGFLPEPLGEQGGEWRLVTVGGVPTMVCEVGRYLVTPTQPGTYRFMPGTAKVVVAVPRDRRRRRSFFDSFFDDDFDDMFFGRARGKEVAVGGEPVEFTVKALPSTGKPAAFSGVCAATMAAQAGVSRIELKENESLTYKVTVEGHGDLRSLTAPQLELSENFRVFESKTHPTVELDQGGVRSRIVFEYVLVPTRSGRLTLPPVGFDYFDTTLKTYHRVATEAVTLTVVPGEKEEIVTVSALPAHGRVVRIAGRDINYIREDARRALPLDRPPLHRRPLYWALTLLPFALLAGEALYRRHTNLSAGDLLERRASRALREALRGVADARRTIDDGKAFYSQLRAVLVAYLADKLGQPPAGLVFAEVRSAVAEKGVAAADLDAFADVLERCEMAAFSPVLPDLDARRADADGTDAVLRAVERGWGR